MEDINDIEQFQTSCPHCHSIFKLNRAQLLAADGTVRCSQCDEIFDANDSLHSLDDDDQSPQQHDEQLATETSSEDQSASVTLSEAMNDGSKSLPSKNLAPLYWSIGILSLVLIAITQWIFYDRYQLVQKATHQELVLSVCQLVSCDKSAFKSSHQFTLLERNIFTHPNNSEALLISGSFINEAPFAQTLPALKISLFNIQSEVIAQRIFKAEEYQQNHQSAVIVPGETIHFKLEIEDPNTVTITYEFEFT